MIYPDKIPGTELEIVDHLGEISSDPRRGTCKDINLIEVPMDIDDSITEPKFDIREWSADHTKASYGILLDETEAQDLVDILFDLDIIPSQLKPFLSEYDGFTDYYKEEPDETDSIPGQMSIFDDF